MKQVVIHQKKVRRLTLGVGCIVMRVGCERRISDPPPGEQLNTDGVLVAYVNGCDGCKEIERGDVILAVDGTPVRNGADLDATNYADGRTHALSVVRFEDGGTREVAITATPPAMPPIEQVPPFWSTATERLAQTPMWARRRLFGHAIPSVMLYSSSGGLVTGRDLYGRKRFIALFDWQTREEQAVAQTFLQVMQKAKADLESVGYDLMLVQLKFPGRDRPPMNDTDLRDFVSQAQVAPKDGGPLPLPRTYRYPNAMEYSSANDLGLEGATTLVESLGASPAILIVDERGIVLWNSEGAEVDRSGKLPADVYTAVSAVMRAMEIR